VSVDLITQREAAAICQVSRNWFRAIRSALTPHETGAGTMYDRAEVERFAAERPSRPRKSRLLAAPALPPPPPPARAPASGDPVLAEELAIIATAPVSGEHFARVAHTWTPRRRKRLVAILRERDPAMSSATDDEIEERCR